MMPATNYVHQLHGPHVPVSTNTVCRRLWAASLRNHRSYVRPNGDVSTGKNFVYR